MTGGGFNGSAHSAERRAESRGTGRVGAWTEVVVRRGCALVVAAVAAYASYEHQRSFALAGGADATSATLWPLSVDGLLVLATVGLLTPAKHGRRRARVVVWLAFLAGIMVSLAANIAAAPALAWQPVLVAGWPPVALLLAVELLAHPRGAPTLVSDAVDLSPARESIEAPTAVADSAADTASGGSLRVRDRCGAERIMWDHLQRELAQGRTPSGAELDRVKGDNHLWPAGVTRVAAGGASHRVGRGCSERGRMVSN